MHHVGCINMHMLLKCINMHSEKGARKEVEKMEQRIKRKLWLEMRWMEEHDYVLVLCKKILWALRYKKDRKKNI